MQIKELRAQIVKGPMQSAVLVHALRDDFIDIKLGTRGPDAVVVVLYDADLSPVHTIRQASPEMPIVMIADARTDFGDLRLCTKLGNAAMVLSPIDDVRSRHLIAAIYAAVPGSITF